VPETRFTSRAERISYGPSPEPEVKAKLLDYMGAPAAKTGVVLCNGHLATWARSGVIPLVSPQVEEGSRLGARDSRPVAGIIER
jgi:hypothetical protein